MTVPLERPIAPVLSSTPSLRARKQEAIDAATRRAEERFEIARYLATQLGSLSEKQAAIARAVARGVVRTSWVPSRATVRTLERMYLEGKVSVADYRDDLVPRGPKPKILAPRVIDIVQRLAERHGTKDQSRSFRHAK